VTGVISGYCFSCAKQVKDPYGKPKTVDQVDLPKKKTKAEMRAEVEEVLSFKTQPVRSRKLLRGPLKFFGVRVSMSEKDGKTPTAMYFPIEKKGVTTGYYVKTFGKNRATWSIGDVKKGEPFGWKEARKTGAYRLIITEGKEDAVAVKQIFERHGTEEYMPAIIALPNGTNSVNSSLGPIADEINAGFKEVVLLMDPDKAGKKALAECMQLIPGGLTATLPEHDANECVVKGSTKAAYKAMSFNGRKPKNTSIIVADAALHESAREPTPYGELTWPFQGLNRLLRNIRLGETIYIGAAVKMGKSELLNAIAAHIIKYHRVPVFMAKPEEENKKTYKLMCNKMVGAVFHDPDVKFSYKKYDKAGKMLAGKLMMVNLYQHMGWETLRKDIIQAASLGAKAIFIDPVTNLTNGMSASDANTKLQEIAQDLAAMAKDLNVVVFIFCHLKANDGNISKESRAKKYKLGETIRLGNCPHEFGGDISSSQFAGSRAMMRSANLMIALEGNKDPDLPKQYKNMRWLTILEDREFGNSDSIALRWDRKTTMFTEVPF